MGKFRGFEREDLVQSLTQPQNSSTVTVIPIPAMVAQNRLSERKIKNGLRVTSVRIKTTVEKKVAVVRRIKL